MTYNVIDFKCLVSKWYNEFLPEHVSDKATFLENIGIVYLNKVSLEPLKKDTIRFFVESVRSCSDSNTTIVVQEPKPVNNPKLYNLLKLIDTSSTIANANKEKILHLANRRYLVKSSDILISQDKEMDSFLDEVFFILMKLNLPLIRFYSSKVYAVQEVIEEIRGFLPKNLLKVQDIQNAGSIMVESSNDVLYGISLKLVKEEPIDSSTSRFLNHSRDALISDIEKLI